MTVIAVVGGQYGGEGKGKIVSFLDHLLQPDIIAKGGGPNGGHRVVTDSFDYTFRMLPAHVRMQGVTLAFGGGSLIDINELQRELALFSSTPSVLIDPHAGVIAERHVRQQTDDPRYEQIGTMYRGTGPAVAERAMRRLRLARELKLLQRFLYDIPEYIHSSALEGNVIILEGSQSAHLSNYHGDYPYCTSRDSTVASLCSQIGIGIRLVDKVVLVLKCFPTRNHAGRLPSEIEPNEAEKIGIIEFNVEGIRRRVGTLNIQDIKRSSLLNTPTDIALTGVDYFDDTVKGATRKEQLTKKVLSVIEKIECALSLPVSIISTGPKYYETVSYW